MFGDGKLSAKFSLVLVTLCLCLLFVKPASAFEYDNKILIEVDPADAAKFTDYSTVVRGDIGPYLEVDSQTGKTKAGQKIFDKLGLCVVELTPELGKILNLYIILHNKPEVKAVQLSYFSEYQEGLQSSYTDRSTPNDPYYPSQWHHAVIHSQGAWKAMNEKAGAKIACLDSGCWNWGDDIQSMVIQQKWKGVGINNQLESDQVGFHGTRVAFIAGATGFNGKGMIGVSPKSYIYNWIITSGIHSGRPSDGGIINQLHGVIEWGQKIANIGVNMPKEYSLANAEKHPVLHKVLKCFHDQHGGIIFAPAANYNPNSAGTGVDQAQILPYLIVVEGVDRNLRCLNPNGTGRPTWFVAPGQSILSPGPHGAMSTRTGNSFASAIVASIAALVWGANPGLTNTQVEQILAVSSSQPHPEQRGKLGYYGLPDAEKAVKSALGQ